MKPLIATLRAGLAAAVLASAASGGDPQPPYDVRPAVEPPFYRVRYEASAQPGELAFPVTYTAWIPPGVGTLKGVIVHQHGCGEGSCSSGLTGAHDLHWQALARRHACALVSPAYEQPVEADCQLWCDPRKGSARAFERGLADLGAACGHAELATVPWALWGHSGGGQWAGGMATLAPERVVAVWLRSGVPRLIADPDNPQIAPYTIPDATLAVPMMCNPGTQEGVTVKDGRFARVWERNLAFFTEVRSRGGLIGVAVDPLTAHECGNQRYLAIPWLDACLAARLPRQPGEPLGRLEADGGWLAPITGGDAVPAAGFGGDPRQLGWLPNEPLARAWMQYVKDTAVADPTPPPAPKNVWVAGRTLSWTPEADLESGVAGFIIERDGSRIARVPEKPKNPFGRPLFQSLGYSDSPPQPLVPASYTDPTATREGHVYRVIALNTVGLESPPSAPAGRRQAAATDAPEPAPSGRTRPRLTPVAFARPAGPEATVRPQAVAGFLTARCVECHAGGTAEGGLDLAALPPAGADVAADRRWARVIERVERGEMPPADAAAPEAAERRGFTEAAGHWLADAIRRRDAAEGRVRGRQLAPRELERSLYALLGIDIPLASLIPLEGRPGGYTTVAERQTVSHHRLQSHLAVVDAALDEAFRRATSPRDEFVRDFAVEQIVRKNPEGRVREPELLDGAAVVWASNVTYYGRLPVATAPADGWYRFRLRVRALKPPKTGGVWCTVNTGLCVSSAPLLQFVTSFEAVAEPREIEFEAWLPRTHMLEIRPGDTTLKQAKFQGGQVGAGEGGPQDVPGIAMERLRMERIHRGADDDGVRRLLGGDLAWERDGKSGRLRPVSRDPRVDAAALVKAFTRRAFRRPVSDAEAAPFVAFATAVLDGGRDLPAALRAAYRAVLCSPRFAYLVESPGRLDDHALAARLSYFLTGGPPDAPLQARAEAGGLADPAAIVAETDRLLAGRGLKRFVEDFAAEWLDLDQIDFTEPDHKLYREFDAVVKHAMVAETHAFLEETFRDDLPVTRFVRDDATFLDSRLARYYRIDGVKGDSLRRVSVPAGSHRGGLLTQGAILKVTANGSTTSPVVRGAWVAERLLGLEIPPPPSGVPAIEPDIRGATTIRQQLERHRSDAACAACHRLMDPVGFALENFDPAGQWRTEYPGPQAGKKGRGQPVDAADTLAGGQKFSGVDEFKQLLAAHPRRIARSLAGHLVEYGTGARLSFADRQAVEEIARTAEQRKFGARSILHAVVTHPIFTSK